jgi:HK97 gp10 family phage protein
MSQVEGLGRLTRKLHLIPAKVIEAAEASLEASAEQLVQMMRRLAPKDSGDLAASIGWTWGDAPKGALVIGTFRGKGGGARAKANLVITVYAGGKGPGFDAFYARFQEFGTVKMRANPFFFPAYRARKRAIRSKLTRDVKKAIRSA